MLWFHNLLEVFNRTLGLSLILSTPDFLYRDRIIVRTRLTITRRTLTWMVWGMSVITVLTWPMPTNQMLTLTASETSVTQTMIRTGTGS